jgi:hypothetical protein
MTPDEVVAVLLDVVRQLREIGETIGLLTLMVELDNAKPLPKAPS